MAFLGLGWTELIIILVIVLVIFGPKRLPALGKSLGKTVKNVRDEMSGDGDGDAKDAAEEDAEEAAADAPQIEADVEDAEPVEVADDAKYSVSALDIPAEMGLAELNGHNITLSGYYAGLAEPVQRMMVTSIVDKGAVETVYWAEDFEWLEPWTSQTPAGDTIGDNNSDATAQQLGTNKVDDVSTYNALLAKGYEIIATHHPDKAERKPEAQTYLQRNYLKFGLTGYQSGIVLPKIEGVPSDTHLLLSFDTSTQRQGSGVFDDTILVVIVETGTDRNDFELTVPHPETNGAYKWYKVEVDLKDVKVTPDTKITIRNADSQWPSSKALRWYLDNIKITKGE